MAKRRAKRKAARKPAKRVAKGPAKRKVAKRTVKKAAKRKMIERDKHARKITGIRSAREAVVFEAPQLLALHKNHETPELESSRNCYVCKTVYTKLHHVDLGASHGVADRSGHGNECGVVKYRVHTFCGIANCLGVAEITADKLDGPPVKILFATA